MSIPIEETEIERHNKRMQRDRLTATPFVGA